MTWGPDLSNHNPAANLRELRAAGASFVFLKATEGVTFTDGLYAGYRRQALAAGLPFGAYHFAHPQPGRLATAEAEHFLSVAGPLVAGNLPRVLDLEWTMLDRHGTAQWALTWLRTVEAHDGVKPLLYTFPSFMADHVEPVAELAAFPLWLASYRSDSPPAPAPWRKWHIWQHTKAAQVPGVPGLVDRSVASVAALAEIGLKVPRVAPAPRPTPAPHAPAHNPPAVVRGGGVVLGSRVLVKGDRGPDVAYVQRFLGIPADGAFGDQTEKAVKGYQHMRGMRLVDGEVGPLTWRPMLGR